MGLLTAKNSSANPSRRLHQQSSRTEIEVTSITMSSRGVSGRPEVNNNNKANQQTPKKSKTSLINKLFKRKKTVKSNVTSSSSTDSEPEEHSSHLRFFSKRKSKRKSSGVKNVTEKFDHVVLSPERKVQTISDTSPYPIRQVSTRLEYENNIVSPNNGQTQEHLYINTTDIHPRPSQYNDKNNSSNHDALRDIANEEEYLRRLKISSQRRKPDVIHKKSNDVNSSIKRSNNGRGTWKELPSTESASYPGIRFNSHERNDNSQFSHRGDLKVPNGRMHYRSDDNISRTYENSAMFDHLNGNLSSPSARRSHKHLSDGENVSLRRRNSKTETNSSSENVNSNSLSRRSRAARNERYYKRLSRDHEIEKLALPLSPKIRHKPLQLSNSLPMTTHNSPIKINYAPRYPNFQKMNQPYYNMNSTYPIPQSAGNSSRVSSTSSLNRTAQPYSPQGAVVNSPRTMLSSYHNNYPSQQNENMSRISSTSTLLSHATSSNYPTFPPTDMKLVHAIPFKSVSYDCNMNTNFVYPARDTRSMSFDHINPSKSKNGRKVPPNPPPRNPNRKTIAIYEVPNTILQCDQKRHSSHQPYENSSDSSSLYHNDKNTQRLSYNEGYTGERAYLIKQAHPNLNTYSSKNSSDSLIRNQRSQYSVQSIHPEEILKHMPSNNLPTQAYFHHKDKTQIGSNQFHPDSRYTNNDRLNEPNQYNRTIENGNGQFYSVTSKIIPSTSQESGPSFGYTNEEQLYENTPAIITHSSQQYKRASSISPPDSRNLKHSFTDRHFSDPHLLINSQRLTKSNETLPLDEKFIRMNQVGIPVVQISNNKPQFKAPSVKRPLKETTRPLSIVLEKSENEMDSEKNNHSESTRISSIHNDTKTNVRKVNENGLRITREGRKIKGSASNLDDALTELEEIYESLNLNDEDLLDRAERRDLPLCYQISKDSVRDTPEIDEINRILGNPNNTNGKPRRIAIPNKVNDDMATRKYRYQKETPVHSTNSETGSYLLTSPTFSPPPFFDDKPASPITLVDVEPDITRDDVVYRNTKYVNNLLKVHEPQPFGIPVRPVINSNSSDYLHIMPDNEKYRSTFHSSKTPDVVMDDLAYRSLRKDYNKDCNSLSNFNLIPSFRSDRTASPLPEKDQYLSNMKSEERFQKKKKRAVRSLSGNLLMRDYRSTVNADTDQQINDYHGCNDSSQYVRSETTSPEYHGNKYAMLESEFEKLKERWLSTPSPEDMKRQKSRDRSLLSYIKENSVTKKSENAIQNTECLEKSPSGEINISSEVENLRRKFVVPELTSNQRTDKSNPFKKMLHDNFDISPEIEAIRKKFIAKTVNNENKNRSKSVEDTEKPTEGVEYKNYFKTLKDQFDDKKKESTITVENKNLPESPKKKSREKKSTKKIDSKKDNPFISKFENIRNIFSEKNEAEVKELIKPKKKIKKFRETNNNTFSSANDFYDYKTNMDRNIDTIKNRARRCDPKKSNYESYNTDTTVSDPLDKTENGNPIELQISQKQQLADEANVMTKEDELLQIIAKETTETSKQINQKLKQLETSVVQHKAIKLNQFPISLDDGIDEQLKSDKKEKQTIFKNAQTVSIESEYDNIPKSIDTPDRNQNNRDLEDLNFEDLSIPHDSNVYEKLDLTNLVKVGKIINKFENKNFHSQQKVNDTGSVKTINNTKNASMKQMSITSEYDNMNVNDKSNLSKMAFDDFRNKDVLLKEIDTKRSLNNEYSDQNFVSLAMKNIPSDDLESLATSENEIIISEISDEELNSQDLALINSFFQNDKAINTVGIRISEIKNLNFESDSSFNSEVHNIFNPQSKAPIDEDCTDSEVDNLPIDLHIEILEKKSISSLDNDSVDGALTNLDLANNNRDKYSIELERTLDTVVMSETMSDSLKTLCSSPADEVVSKGKMAESTFATTNENIPTVDEIETKTSQIDHSDLTSRSEEPSPIQDDATINCLVENNRTKEISGLKTSKSTESNDDNNNNEDKMVSKSPEFSSGKILRSKSSGNVSTSNGISKSTLCEDMSNGKVTTTSSSAPRNASVEFGKCCSSSSSSNLDLCSSETSSKSSSNPCQDLTPVRRRRSLPESPMKTIGLSSLCASLTRPEGVK